ncbi:MAG: hypothetical protein LC640_06930, partial [Frankia sp.]|nr:hypothetical protein [Frankia sp.]MCA1833580.1 hypothetical protein [Actinomycetota bacterium]
MTGFLLLAAAGLLLATGAELFASNATGAGRRLGVSMLAIGLVLAGAEPEELLTAVVATLRHHPALAAGDAVGANVTMLTAVLGLAALLRPVPVGRRVREYAGAAVVVGLLALMALVDDRVARSEGLLLVAGYVVLVAVIWRREHQPPAFGELAEVSAATGDPAPIGTGDPAPTRTDDVTPAGTDDQ